MCVLYVVMQQFIAIQFAVSWLCSASCVARTIVGFSKLQKISEFEVLYSYLKSLLTLTAFFSFLSFKIVIHVSSRPTLSFPSLLAGMVFPIKEKFKMKVLNHISTWGAL